ncbi:MAG: GntR family transcriptional regulator [Clostridia bacterium]|nr:GntR family transcriptional regulator [Clostridia bacterium]
MKIIVSGQSELPIYAQIEAQLKEQILSGELPEGTVLPSIRGLAKAVGVSVITTTRAYADLEREGYIASLQGRGTVVLPQSNALLREQQLRRIEESLAAAIGAAKRIGMDRAELSDILDALWRAEE